MKNKSDWLIFFVIVGLIFIAAGRTATDTDMWWHLRAGEETIARGFPLMEDAFSSTVFGKAWINHSWLAEVVIFFVYKAGGFAGLGLLMAVVCTASMGLIFFQMSGPTIFRAFLMVLGMGVAAVVWTPRPQIFSLLLFAVVQLILYLNKWKNRDHLLWLPVVFILWSNLHGGYPLGLILIGVALIGEVLNRWLKPDVVEVLSWARIRKIGVIGVVCAVAVIVNPNGFNMWLIPFQMVEMNATQYLIQEWASPDFHEVFQQPFLWLLLGVTATFGLSGKRADSGDVLGVIVFGGMGLLSRRLFGIFALTAVVILSRYLWIAIQALVTGRRESHANEVILREEGVQRAWQKVINLLIVGALFFLGLVKVAAVNSPDFIQKSLEQTMPVGATAWLKEHPLSGSMLNDYNWGGYLSWELRETPIFIDGRADLYGDKIIEDWVRLVRAGEDWEELLIKYGIGFALLQPQAPIVKELQKKGWVTAYSDSISILLSHPAAP